jgi:hypothetical protein
MILPGESGLISAAKKWYFVYCLGLIARKHPHARTRRHLREREQQAVFVGGR